MASVLLQHRELSSGIGPGGTEFSDFAEADAQAVDDSAKALRRCGERSTFKGNEPDSLSTVPAIFPQPDVSLGLRPAGGLAPNCLGRPLRPVACGIARTR